MGRDNVWLITGNRDNVMNALLAYVAYRCVLHAVNERCVDYVELLKMENKSLKKLDNKVLHVQSD